MPYIFVGIFLGTPFFFFAIIIWNPNNFTNLIAVVPSIQNISHAQ